MNYKQKYKDALDLARTFYEGYIIQGHNGEAGILAEIFPELKESEEERIRKMLRAYIHDFGVPKEYFVDVETSDVIAWLEKQKEFVSADFDDVWETADCDELTAPLEKYSKDAIKEMCHAWYDKGIELERRNWFEKQGEQMPNDKVEPKFKVGNWYKCTKDFFGKGVTFDKNTAYYCAKEGCLQDEYGCHIAIVKDLYDSFKLWDISDAKDGDVLSFNDGHGNDCIELIKSITGKKIEFWFCLTNGNRYEVFDGITPYTNLASRENSTPATKEQRDLLFQKMKEAGYEWNTTKKELKKIGSKTLDPDKVIEWFYDQACQGWVEDDEVDIFVNRFKKDFGL